MAVDDVQAYADDDGCGVAREDADGASSRPARRVPVDFRCAEATSHFRGSSSRGCDRHPRRPYRRDNPSLGCPTRNFRPLKHNANREPFQSAPDLGGCRRPSPPPSHSAAAARYCTCSCVRLNGTGVVNCINRAGELSARLALCANASGSCFEKGKSFQDDRAFDSAAAVAAMTTESAR